LNGFLGRPRIARIRIVQGRLELAVAPPPHPLPQPVQPASERGLLGSLKRLGNLRAAGRTKGDLPD
jgi:hypothetical protein